MKLSLSNSIVTIDKSTTNIICETIDEKPIIHIYNICSEVISIFPKSKELAEKDFNKLLKSMEMLFPAKVSVQE